MRKQLVGYILLGIILASIPYLPIMGTVQAGTTLTASVYVTPHWTITYGWTIDKSVTPDSWEFRPGESGTSTYTITVTKDSGTEEAWVEGQVCITNGGNVATENLEIVVVLKNGYPPPNDYLTEAPVDVSSNPVLDPGETGCYNYRINIPISGGDSPQPHASGTYKVTADVTITNHSGSLGVPFGPNPSATTIFPSMPTLINSVIHVDDTNGGSWEFSESSYVTYDKTFTCADVGVNVNTATIRETGQSDSATVTVTCITPPQATISGVKYYDVNVNGERNYGEVGIQGWKIQLWKEEDGAWTLEEEVETGSEGDYVFTVTEAGTYGIVEVMPSGMWVRTAPEDGRYTIIVTLGGDYPGNDFGNVCLMPGTGGKTLGFWSNKNGQALITFDDVNALNDLNLYQPSEWAYPPFDTTDLAKAKTQIKNYLLSATARDMRWMLSAQLIATRLNVLHGFLSGSTIVYVGPSTYVPSGFISINKIMENAKDALFNGNKAEQEYWKNLLDGLNNNRLPFVCPEPCYPIEYPP